MAKLLRFLPLILAGWRMLQRYRAGRRGTGSGTTPRAGTGGFDERLP